MRGSELGRQRQTSAERAPAARGGTRCGPRRAGALRALVRRRPPPSEAPRRRVRSRGQLAIADRGRQTVLAEGQAVPGRGGSPFGDRPPEDRRGLRRRQRRRDPARRPCGEQRRRSGTRHGVRGGGGCAGTEADGRPGAHAADWRRERECLLPRRHGADRRRISRLDDRHGLRRIGPAPRPTRFPGPGLRARSAAHRRVRRPCPRRRSDVEVPRALGPVRARDDGSRLRDRRPPNRARARRGR